MKTIRLICASIMAWHLATPLLLAEPVPTVKSVLRCENRESKDQDDLCIWVHPTERTKSTLIVADKAANRIFVYDLAGKMIGAIAARHPGNIDVRYGFTLGNEKFDIVAHNDRDRRKVLVYKVNPASRLLERIDDDAINTQENYGGTLYHSRKSNKFYFVTTSYPGHVEQFELFDNGSGKVSGKRVRTWKIGLSEAAVADDDTGQLYIGEEQKGVWQFDAEPTGQALGKLVIKRGENGLVGDVEGLAIYPMNDQDGYLVVSNQSANNFKVYERQGEHKFVATFAIAGAKDTDGLDLCRINLGGSFSDGLFACHSDEGARRPILVTPLSEINRSLGGVLKFSPRIEVRR